MPKYILHGGYEAKASPLNDDFYDAIAESLPQSGKVLMVYFAREESGWDARYKKDVVRIQSHAGHKAVKCEMATFENFENQFESADVIYFRGGRTSIMLASAKRFPKLKSMLEGAVNKTIVGASAGANLLCQEGLGTEGLNQGLGVVPISVWVHSDNPKYLENYAELKKVSDNKKLMFLHLPEHKSITLEF